MISRFIVHSLLLVILSGISPAAAQETRTVTVIGQAYVEGNKTTEEARREALQNARAKAAEQAGVNIASQLLGLAFESSTRRFQAYTELIRSSARGRIVREQDSTWAEIAPGTTIPVYYVKLTAEIVTERGQRDVGFSLDIRVNGQPVLTDDEPVTTFRAGDELILTVTPTQDCYLTVFNVLPNDTVTVLAPTEYLRDTFIQADAPFQLPTESLRQQGRHLRVEPLDGQRESAEMLLVVATKTRVPFRGATVQTGQAALLTINRWLIDIPLDQRTEASVLYRIVR